MHEPHPRFGLLPGIEDPPSDGLDWVKDRPEPRPDQAAEAPRYLPDPALWAALEAAVTLGEPMLVTGEPGTGKTQLAYHVAYKLGLGVPHHFQVRSTSTARELLYSFDTIAYFREAYLARELDARAEGRAPPPDNPALEDPVSGASSRPETTAGSSALAGPIPRTSARPLPSADKRRSVSGSGPHRPGPGDVGLPAVDKRRFISKGKLWLAIDSGRPEVILVDEIDKAPRDFPNDLLHELDQMAFTIPELDDFEVKLEDPRNRPIVVITSNSERRLPEAFLRRCVYHHIRLTDERIEAIIEHRRQEFETLSDELVKLAVSRFLDLRKLELQRKPSTGELLVWLRALSHWSGRSVEVLRRVDLGSLPCLGMLIKTRDDLEEVRRG